MIHNIAAKNERELFALNAIAITHSNARHFPLTPSAPYPFKLPQSYILHLHDPDVCDKDTLQTGLWHNLQSM